MPLYDVRWSKASFSVPMTNGLAKAHFRYVNRSGKVRTGVLLVDTGASLDLALSSACFRDTESKTTYFHGKEYCKIIVTMSGIVIQFIFSSISHCSF